MSEFAVILRLIEVKGVDSMKTKTKLKAGIIVVC